MSDLDFIKMEALSLATDETVTTYCPSCDNAKPYPPSLSITRKEDGIIYNCWRASCSFSGFVGSISSGTMVIRPKIDVWRPKPYQGRTFALGPKMYHKLYEEYKLTKEYLDQNLVKLIESPHFADSGLLFPLFDVSGNRFGTTTKWFNTLDKARHHLEVDETLLHFPLSGLVSSKSTAILTEDTLSAMRCCVIRQQERYQGVALLGTQLNEDKVRILLKHGYRDVILALDPDALWKAVDLTKKWKLFFRTFRVVSLSKDPKDLNHPELYEELGI